MFFFFKKINNLLHGAYRQTMVSTKYLLRYTDRKEKKIIGERKGENRKN